MRGLAIEFHGNRELLVAVVQVACPTTYPAHGLPLCSGEPMRPLDLVYVAPLERRLDALVYVGESAGQLHAPAEPGPGCHRSE
jgi:hypothetical protein